MQQSHGALSIFEIVDTAIPFSLHYYAVIYCNFSLHLHMLYISVECNKFTHVLCRLQEAIPGNVYTKNAHVNKFKYASIHLRRLTNIRASVSLPASVFVCVRVCVCVCVCVCTLELKRCW